MPDDELERLRKLLAAANRPSKKGALRRMIDLVRKKFSRSVVQKNIGAPSQRESTRGKPAA
jgi:hypothetical protein